MFPQTQLPLRVKIAPGANPAADPITWPAWVDISADVRLEQGVELADGRPNEAATVDPGDATFTVDNRGGKYVVGNPNGAFYPLLRRNCPCRIGVEVTTDNFNRTTSNGWGALSGPNFPGMSWTLSGAAADWSTTGTQAQINIVANTARLAMLTGGAAYNVEGKATFSVSAVATGDALIWGAVARYIDNNNYYQIQLRFAPGGVIQLGLFRVRNGGGLNVVAAFTTVPGTYAAGTRVCMRWQVNGANILSKAWLESGSEPLNWQQSATDTSQIVRGGGNGLTPWRQGSNTNVGTIIMSVDDYLLESIEWSGNLSELPVRWDQSGNDSTAPLKASGVLRRLQQGAAPLKSPLYRQLIAQSPTGYWPLEDDSGATAPTSALSATQGVKPAGAVGATFGAAGGLPGSSQEIQFSDVNGQLTFYPNTGSVGTGMGVMFLFKWNTLPGTTMKGMFSIYVQNGPVRRWGFDATNTNIQLTGYDSDNNVVVTGPSTIWVEDPTKWIALQFETEVVGANTNWALTWHSATTQSAPFWQITGSFANTIVSRCTALQIFANTVYNGMYVAHAWIGSNAMPFVTNAFAAVANGYIGELAADRVARLCREENVIAYSEPGTSTPMGAQAVNSLIPLLRECEATDMGVLYEDGFGLGYRPRSQRYGKTIDITLDRSQGHLAEAPEPTIDDQNISNSVTASRPNGAQNVLATNDAHIAAEGQYNDSITINSADDSALPYAAQWRVFLGTRPDLRWPSVSLDFARNTLALLSAWRGRQRWGSRAVMVNEPSQVQSLAPDMIIEGVQQTLNAYEWTATANTSPAQPWDVAVADSTALGRCDTAGSQLTTAVNTTATSFVVATTTGPVWRTGAYPSTLMIIEGEIVAVTNIASASSPQTFTIGARSVNGVIKSHGISASISLAFPARAGL
jgi:hypothetical protein